MANTKAMFLTAWWASAAMLAGTIHISHAWMITTTPTTNARSLHHARSTAPSPPLLTAAERSSISTGTGTSTALFGKKKKKSGGGSAPASAKMQVKLLQHIPGTGQAGDVIMVNPIFFANKLRPQKLARAITDEEVQKDLEEKQEKSAALQAEARALKELLDDNDDNDSSLVLEFLDNQTGPDGKKLFGGIGPKKL
eukprot:jgi/Psemu1/315645/fgenesh1_kg.2304_\